MQGQAPIQSPKRNCAIRTSICKRDDASRSRFCSVKRAPPRRSACMPANLSGQTILVTGAAKRIGRGIALRLAREGARVAIHYDRSEEEARRTAEECGGAPLFRANL